MNTPPESLQLALIVGSSRRASLHRVVAEAVVESAPAGVSIVEVPLAEVPFFDQDVEDVGDPAAVTAMKAAVAGADALVIVTPEYNGSMPAVVKNAVDWLSRPYGTGPIAGTPTMIIAGTPGRHDAAGVREALARSATIAGAAVHEPTHGIASLSRQIDDGRLATPDVRDALEAAVAAFVEAVREGVAVTDQEVAS